MRDLSSLQRDILYVMYGQGELRNVKDGSLFPALQELIDNGYIFSEEVDGRTNKYKITQRGKDSLFVRREWEDSITDRDLKQ